MTKSLAEQLGFAPKDRIAVIHADDIGMCHSANEGAFAALLDGPATCGSIMVPCPWFREAAERARAHPDLDLGVHLTLNAEWSAYRWGPVAGRSAVPTLLDDEGYLPRSLVEVAERAEPEEVEIELRAQVAMAMDAGIDVTHLDAHMGTAFLPKFLPVYQGLAVEFQVPVLAARPDEATLEASGMAGAKPIFDGMADSFEAKGYPVLDGLDANSLDFAHGEGAAHNTARLDGLGVGVSYLICHPAADGEELRSITPDSAHHRDFERGFYGGSSGRKALEERGVDTLGMRALRDLLRAS
ncbi:MAG: ChbG/HpnK family deacetylase [bacterium]|nr:ChbG/HpnK family deacetylase [bacterium]